MEFDPNEIINLFQSKDKMTLEYIQNHINYWRSEVEREVKKYVKQEILTLRNNEYSLTEEGKVVLEDNLNYKKLIGL